MIQYRIGDLLKDDAQALVNTVNTEGVMGKGIALQFKETFPNNYRIYRKVCKEGKLNIGEMLVTEEYTLLGDKKYIVNFPTKTTWRKPSEYSYIGKGLYALKDEIEKLHIMSIAIPPLGSNNGGLDWQKVKQMIEIVLENLDCDIRIYEPSSQIVERLKNERPKLTPARGMLLYMLCDLVASGEYVSAFAAEKCVYFLQKFGAEDVFKTNFKRGPFGPYSGGKVSHMMYSLNGAYFRGMGAMENKAFQRLWLMEDTAAVVKEYMNKNENAKYKEIADRTSKFLSEYYSDYSLELLATVDYILRDDYSLRLWNNMDNETLVPLVKKDIDGWSERKERKFSDYGYIEKIVSHLREYYSVIFDNTLKTGNHLT